MRRGSAIVESIRLHPCGTPVVQLSCPPALTPGPGQAVMAHKPGSQQALRHPLFPIEVGDQGFAAFLPQAADWPPGSLLDVWGPLAKGFDPPVGARHWLLVCHHEWSGSLLPLIRLGLRQSCAIALQTTVVPPDLPREVEIIDDLMPAMGWADYLAAEAALHDLHELHGSLRPSERVMMPRACEVLVRSDLGCGFGACGACAIPARRHWRLACVEGPVFDFKTLGW
jgi:hypothetical protein